MKPCFHFILLLFTLLFVSCKTQVDPSLIIARQGRMDLSSWDITKNGKISLDGEWEFYGNQLLTPGDFKKENKKPDEFLMVPSAWNDQNMKSQKFTGQYGTYRLTIVNCPGPDLLALRLWEANSSYLLWVNDQMVA